MKSGTVLNPASFMKRFLLSSLVLLTMGQAAFGYINSGTIQVPPMDPSLIQIDDPNFYNRGRLSIDLTSQQNITGAKTLFTTTDTLNYTNSGILIGIPGFDFETFPASVGSAHWAANFVNTNTGAGSGIFITNVYGGANEFTINSGGLLFPISSAFPGLATLKVRATNILDSGLVTMDNTGLIDFVGKDLNLNRAQFRMTTGPAFFLGINGLILGDAGNFGINAVDYGSGLFGNTNNQPWEPGLDLTANSAFSSAFVSSVNGFFEQMVLTNSTSYFENTAPSTNADGTIVWRAIFLQDSSPANVTNHVYFGEGVGNGTLHIEWVGVYRDPATGGNATNYFYLSDEPALRRVTNGFTANPPSDFQYTESSIPGTFANPATPPSFVNPVQPPNLIVTNDYSYISLQPVPTLVATNSVVGGSPTNLPGRVQLTASDSMNLANVQITGPNYLALNAPVNFLGNSNSFISSPYTDLNLGVTNGSLTISNLMLPTLAAWTGVPGAPTAVFGSPMDGLQAWSASFFFVDANGITNDVRVLLVNSALQPTASTYEQNVKLHSPNLVISDELNIFGHFFSDATSLTVTTNGSSAFSLAGALNFLSSDIFLSTSLPNLQYLTNFGTIFTTNLVYFAGNISNPTGDPSSATPYQAFVNHGKVITDGAFIRANYFENAGLIEASPDNYLDIAVNGDFIGTNGSFIAPQGSVSLLANSLLLSNGVITAGQGLTLGASCFVSDGYVFGNEFGHVTNSVLPNVVTNGNIWSAGGGIQVVAKPDSGDLLGTTITNASLNGASATTIWPGEDRGQSPDGFANNLAVGRMILNVDGNGGVINFTALNGNGALYVDSLEFQGGTTNTDANGNPASIAIQSGMTIYYAQALQNGVSVAEKINGKFGAAGGNGGRFLWVSNYAGVYSSTNMQYPDGNTYIFNQALAVSPDIDSDGDGTVNRDDPTPIPTGITFDIINNGPVPCGGGITNNPNPDPGTNAPLVRVPGALSFPQEQAAGGGSDSGSVSFTLAQGSYNGLFYDTNGVTPSSSGFFTAKVTAKGGMTAKLTLGSHTYSFAKPVFDGTGHYSGTATSKGLPSLTVDLQLVNNDEIQGQVTGDGWTAQLVADLAGFGSKNKAPWVGNNTVLLQTDPTNSTAAAGGAFGSANISKSGAVQWSGTLPDGTKVSQKSALSKDGLWPLYSSLYGGAGSLIGWMQCTNSELGGSAVWIVPAGVKALYPNGLTNGLVAVGSQTTGMAGALSHSTAVISGSSISSITNHVTIIGKTGQSSDGTLQLSVNLKTGFFTGSVVDTNTSQKFSVQGALLEKSGIGGGFFLNSSQDQGGKIYLAPAN